MDELIGGQRNLIDAVERTITHDSEEDERHYELGDETATLIVRPRGWHLAERHMRVDGEPVAGALLDFGLFFHHCAQRLVDRGSGPYLYLPKLEHHDEAALWNDVFLYAQDVAGVPRGTVRATVLVETLPAAFQMEEILHALREHSTGLNAGRWDYIFSAIKCFRERAEFVTPDRGDVTMTVPFMRAYTELLVATCHRRGAHAMGGMAAFVPSGDHESADAEAMEAVHEDKAREAGDGFDGTLGRAPRHRPGGDGGVRRGPRRAPQPDRAPARRRRGDGRRPARRRGRRPARSPRRACATTSASASSTSPLARRAGRGGDRQPHGGRGHGGDLPLAGVAVDPPRGDASRRPQVTRDLVRQILDEEMERIRGEVDDEVWEAGAARTTRARSSRPWRSATTSPSSSRCSPTSGLNSANAPTARKGLKSRKAAADDCSIRQNGTPRRR